MGAGLTESAKWVGLVPATGVALSLQMGQGTRDGDWMDAGWGKCWAVLQNPFDIFA